MDARVAEKGTLREWLRAWARPFRSHVSTTGAAETAPEGDAFVQQALRNSELRYRRLFESARVGILILNAESGRVEDVNPFLCDLVGFAREEIVGRTVGELSPFRDFASNHAMLKRLQKHGYVRYEDLPLETKEGQRVSVELVSNVYKAGYEKVIQCSILDTTERKQAADEILRRNGELEEQVISRTVELQAANRELEAFSHAVSHELHGPLMQITGYLGLLKDEATSPVTKEGRQNLHVVLRTATRMGALFEDLLTFARIGRSEILKEQIDLDQLIQETRRDLAAETRAREIAWDIRPLPAVHANRSLLRLVMKNLISNALKFTRGRSQARLEIGHAPGGERETVIYVRDNGVGFDPRFAGRMFGAFQRLHSRNDFEGTGIGLATVRSILLRHGGRTWADAELGEGATIYFSLPEPNTSPA